MRPEVQYILVALLLILFPRSTLDSTPHRIQTLRVLTPKVDQEKYDTGKRIFLKSAITRRRSIADENISDQLKFIRSEVEEKDEVFEQRLRLMELQGQLEGKEQTTIHLVNMAGKISNEQLLALKYFLYNRKIIPSKFNAGKFYRGEQISSRKVRLQNQPQSTEFLEKRLLELEEKLTGEDRQTLNLGDLKGKLTPEQMEELEYYITIRYKLPKSLDATSYYLGEQVFKGELKGSPGSPEFISLQEKELLRLQKRIPWRVQRRFDLTLLAGQISPIQFEGLKYYLTTQFRTNLD